MCIVICVGTCFFFSSRRRHTRCSRDWSSDVCSSDLASPQNYHDNVMNPALESTYRFIERVVGDLVAMHREGGVPLRHIHMGGDEVPAGVWQGSPAVQTYLKAHDLTSVDDLWFVFYGRVAQILKAQEGGLLPSGNRRTFPIPTSPRAAGAPTSGTTSPAGVPRTLPTGSRTAATTGALGPRANSSSISPWKRNPERTGPAWGGMLVSPKPFNFSPFPSS